MFLITLTMQNPLAPSVPAIDLKFQFDPATMTQAKWAGAFPTVQSALNQLIADTTPKEPAIW